jgi:ribosomal protein L7/L12
MPPESLDCPNCGAPLAVVDGRPVVVCAHCGSSVRVAAPPAAPRPPETTGPYGMPPPDRPPRSELASVTLGPAEAAHVIQLLRDQQQLEAIQYYHAKTGSSLGEAKDAIAAIEAGLKDAAAPLAPPSATSQPPRMDDIHALVKANRKLEAVKRYRELAGVGLNEALTVVEGIERQQGRQPRAPWPARSAARGCFGLAGIVLAFLLCISGGCGLYLRTKSSFHCSIRAVTEAVEQQGLLEPPVRAGYLVLAPGFEESGGFGGSEFHTEYFAPVWGGGGVGVAYVNLAGDSEGYSAMSARLYLRGERYELRPWGELACP